MDSLSTVVHGGLPAGSYQRGTGARSVCSVVVATGRLVRDGRLPVGVGRTVTFTAAGAGDAVREDAVAVERTARGGTPAQGAEGQGEVQRGHGQREEVQRAAGTVGGRTVVGHETDGRPVDHDRWVGHRFRPTWWFLGQKFRRLAMRPGAVDLVKNDLTGSARSGLHKQPRSCTPCKIIKQDQVCVRNHDLAEPARSTSEQDQSFVIVPISENTGSASIDLTRAVDYWYSGKRKRKPLAGQPDARRADGPELI